MRKARYTTGRGIYNSNFLFQESKVWMLGATDRSWGCAGAIVHAHHQVQGHTKAAMCKGLDTNDFGHVFAVHRVVRGGKRKGDKDAHTLIIIVPSCVEVNSFF